MQKRRLTATEKAEQKRQKNLEKQLQKQRERQRHNEQRKAASRDKRINAMRVLMERSRQLDSPTKLHDHGTFIHDSVPNSSHLQNIIIYTFKRCVTIKSVVVIIYIVIIGFNAKHGWIIMITRSNHDHRMIQIHSLVMLCFLLRLL